jgi:hypothetical protein
MEYKVLATWGVGGPHTLPLILNTKMIPPKPTVVSSLENRILHQAKSEINLYYEEGRWDDYKKITNPYEYIFLSWNRRSSRSVAVRQPLSRSYFKMIELWKDIDITKHLQPLIERDGGLRTAHAAEGPGGFIEACAVSAETQSWEFLRADAITLRSEAKNVPGWRKASRFLSLYPQVHIHDGEDGTGNILRVENQLAFVASVREANPAGVHLFTADGGFDFSNDYSAQEDSIFPLLLAECILGLQTLTKGGMMIIKCFDTTEHPTLDLLWLLTRAFCQWGIVKPRTSRAGNAERYFIGKGYLDDGRDIMDVLLAYQERAQFSQPILETVMCDSWKPVLSQIATLQEQIDHLETYAIRETLDLIKSTESPTIQRLVRENVLRSILWCREHGEDITACWISDFERNVTKETSELLNILNVPTNTFTYTSSTFHSTSMSSLSFSGFRNGHVSYTPSANPFMRLKGTKPQ